MGVTKEELEMVKNRRKKVNINIPDKQPDEEPATEKQIAYIMHLGALNRKDLSELGKWQASAIIDEIKAQQSIFTEELVEETIEKRRKSQGCLSTFILCGFTLVVIIYLFIR